MKSKTLWKISVSTLPEADDAVAELMLTCFNEPAATYLDLETGVATITVYLPEKPTWPRANELLKAGLIRIKKCGLQIGTGKISLQKVRRENWAESWKRHFKPLAIGNALLVKPSWSKLRAKKNQAVIILDPGLSFGTGQHPTTSFCLQQVAWHGSKFQVPSSKLGKPPRQRNSKLETRNSKLSFLDIGTGSGILAIAAAKLGYTPVEAFDFDPEAVAIARANAKRNRVADSIHIHQADVTKLPRRGAKKFSVVCANLISTLLISEQARIAATVQAGGTLVLAGILQKEFSQVRSAYEKAGLRLAAERAENEWQSGAFAVPENF